MSDDLVKRYQLDYHHTRTYAEMAEDCDGDWVKYNDYKDAADRIEQLAATNEELSNCVAVLEAKLSKSEALLAKAVEAERVYCANVVKHFYDNGFSQSPMTSYPTITTYPYFTYAKDGE